MLHPINIVDEKATRYPTVTDFFRSFNAEIHSLYLLSFLLTADHDKAEQCLVSAMEESVETSGVLMDWTRGTILKHAIQMIMPAPDHTDCVSLISLKRSNVLAQNDPFAPILLLDAFERFVFVISTLEGQSDEECANLLRCSRRDVMIARVLATKRQSATDTPADEVLQS
jgi:hypothetical protein